MTQDSSIIRPDLIARIHALCEGEDDSIAIMATVSAELFHAVDGYDWVGFYRVVAPDLLKIGPYQGGHGCLVIPFDRGVCGAAARQQAIQLVEDVNRFEGHIACSSSTKSELVIPCFNQGGYLLGVLDIDSDQPIFLNGRMLINWIRCYASFFKIRCHKLIWPLFWVGFPVNLS